MPRVTKATLEAENAKLREELERLRPRSRSPRREVPARLTHAALGMAARDFLRDPAIEELQAVILRQREEIQRLRAGEGPIGEVLLAMRRKDCPTSVTDFVTEEMAKGTQSVISRCPLQAGANGRPLKGLVALGALFLGDSHELRTV